MDNCGNSGANTCIKAITFYGYSAVIGSKSSIFGCLWLTSNNYTADRMVLYRRQIIQVSDLSTFYISI
jgi:hypothetical protein